MTPHGAAGLVLAIGLAGLVAGDGSATRGERAAASALDRAAWSETDWPFLRDQWGSGRALRCAGPSCAADVRLYLRSKVGFCDCFNHVADDDDVDRLTDFDLMGGDRVVPLGPGRALTLAAGPARLRAFRLEGRRGDVHHALAVVVAVDCQARVAMLVSDAPAAAALATAALDLLGEEGPSREADIAISNRTGAVQ